MDGGGRSSEEGSRLKRWSSLLKRQQQKDAEGEGARRREGEEEESREVNVGTTPAGEQEKGASIEDVDAKREGDPYGSAKISLEGKKDAHDSVR